MPAKPKATVASVGPPPTLESVKQAEEVVAKAAELEKAKNVIVFDQANKVQAERELRRYVRKDGGYREGILDADRRRADELLKLLGRDTPVWDRSLDPPEPKDRTS